MGILEPRSMWVCATLVLVLVSSQAKPVRRGPPAPKPVEGDSPEDIKDTGLAYDQYLRQVVEVLESDSGFRQKLESANVSDIKSGKIAMYLEMVNHTVRTALDEIKRREVKRLQELAQLQMQGMSANGRRNFEIPGHLDIRNPHSFEMKDLENLIKKTTSDLEELDKKRKMEFKEYEMEKEFAKQEHLKQLSEEERKNEMERLDALKKKHAQHPKVNHPGSKDQFEEVWEKSDHFEDQEFNPRTFFFKHDLNGDMEWSIEEVDAILQIELDKVYDAKNSPDEDDPVERLEEMNRMREHVFNEMDKDKNFLISLQEFIDYTGTEGNNKDFKQDDGWETLDEQQAFSDEEYAQYIAQHHAQPGVVNPPPDLRFQPEHQFQQQQQQFQQPNQGQQFQQPNQGQQQFQQPNQGQFQQPNQGQFQQPNQGQQFQQPNQGQQQFQQQQFQQPNQGQQQFQQPNQPNMNQQQQLNQNQPDFNQQQQQHHQQQQQQQQPHVQLAQP